MASLFIEQTGFDCGKLLWEWSDAQTMYDRRTQHSRRLLFLTRAYFFLVIGVMLVWFFYSLIVKALKESFWVSVLFHAPALFGIFVGGLILILSAFNLWGKFIRFAFRKGLTENNAENRKLREQVLAADAKKEEESAVRIYSDYIVVINRGNKKILDRAQLRRVVCFRGKEVLLLSFHGTNQFYNAFADIPSSEFPMLKKLLGDLLDVERAAGEGENELPEEKPSFAKKIPLILFLLIFTAAGSGVIAMHYTIAPDVPVLLGAAFIAVSIIMITALFSEHAIIGKGIVPLMLGIFFTAVPIAAMFAIAEYMKVSLLSLLPEFTIAHAAFILFLSVGPFIIASGIRGIVDSIKYRR